jgi:predicted PurR-regulated permease PerM
MRSILPAREEARKARAASYGEPSSFGKPQIVEYGHARQRVEGAGVTARAAWIAVFTAGALVVAWLLRGVLPIVALALLFATLTWPLVRRLERRLPRSAAVVIANAGTAAILMAAGIAIGPVVYAQAQSLIAALPHSAQSLFQSLPGSIREPLTGALSNIDFSVGSWMREGLQATFTVLRSAAAIAGAIVLVPFLAAYLQMDAERYARALYAVIPSEHRRRTERALGEVAAVVGGFVRGQVIVSATVGLLVYGVLLATGVRYAGAIGLFTGVLDLVPYLGGIAAFVPSILLALAYQGWPRALVVFALLVVVFELEAQVLSPKIVGGQTRLPASVVVLSILAGGALFGVLGVYLAIPVAATIGAIARELHES